MPQNIEPMLAVLATVPKNQNQYSFEIKWDGVRAIGYYDGRDLTFQSRNLLDITPRYPELQAITKQLGRRKAILDGEVVALDEHHRPSFALLQQRMHVRDAGAVARLMKQVPVYYFIFDLLYFDGQVTMPLPLTRRRAMLNDLSLAGDSWQVSPSIEGEGTGMYQTAAEQGLEGIVAKKLESPYEPGRRSPNWLKIKIVQSQELVIGGWCPEKGNNRSRIGCLLLGYYENTPAEKGNKAQRRLRYAGSDGTGYTDEIHRQLVSLLEKTPRATSPFADKVPKPGPIWVEPNLVAEIEYRRWPKGGMVQQAAYKGLRMDKKASQVIKEERIPASAVEKGGRK